MEAHRYSNSKELAFTLRQWVFADQREFPKDPIYSVGTRLYLGYRAGRRKFHNSRPEREYLNAMAIGHDLTLVDQDVVRSLRRCETEGIQFKHCPAYIREWINCERR
jgi:hypothetical protein